MELAQWLDTFRHLGRQAERRARPLAGTARGRRPLGRGAAGDTTVFLDRTLEDLVLNAARSAGKVRLISEELGVRDFGEPEAAVVADPLDGSTNAGLGIGLYAVSYALGPPGPHLGDLQMGYVRNLVAGDEYWAVRGKGAFRNGRRLRPQNGGALEMVLLELSPAPLRALAASRRIIGAARKVRSLGSMALDLCYTASGSASATVDLRGRMARTLDLSAGALILEEAGGKVSDARGRPLGGLPVDLSTRTDLMASANPAVHRRLLKLGR